MKQRLKRIAIGSFYGTLTLGIIAVTILLVTIGRGYFFDFRTGQLSGGGLVLIDSRPSGAAILLDGKPLDKTTSGRLPLKAGSYGLRLERQGFRPWQKTVEVVTSEVTWARYPLLIPTDLQPQPILNLAPPVQVEQSEDARWLAIASGGPQPSLQVLEAGTTTPRSVFVMSPEQIAAGFQFESIQWSSDDEHLMLGLRHPGGLNYVVLSVVNPADTLDISKDFSLPLANLQFSSQNWREIYWHSPEGLRKLDLANRTVSAVLAADVTSYRVTPEAVFFTQTAGQSAKLLRLERDNQTSVLVDDLPPNTYHLDYADFDDKRYLVLLNRDNQQVWLYHNPGSSGQELRKFEHISAISVSVGPEDRYLVLQNGRSFASYDLEFDKIYRFELPFEQLGRLSWLDPHHLLAVANGQVTVLEFDGGNVEALMPALNGTGVYGVADDQLVYAFAGAADGSSNLTLQVVNLKR